VRIKVLIAFACGVGIVACGSSAKPGTSSFHDQALEFATCMRSHGVPNFPDPTAGGGIQFSSGSGINPLSPAFQAARLSCHKMLPGGGPRRGAGSAQAKAQMLRVSECMRQHGVSGFPDPTLSPPSNPADYGEITDDAGVVLAIPSTIDPQAPVFRHAAAACNFGG
jgi:hypothetical protein